MQKQIESGLGNVRNIQEDLKGQANSLKEVDIDEHILDDYLIKVSKKETAEEPDFLRVTELDDLLFSTRNKEDDKIPIESLRLTLTGKLSQYNSTSNFATENDPDELRKTVEKLSEELNKCQDANHHQAELNTKSQLKLSTLEKENRALKLRLDDIESVKGKMDTEIKHLYNEVHNFSHKCKRLEEKLMQSRVTIEKTKSKYESHLKDILDIHQKEKNSLKSKFCV